MNIETAQRDTHMIGRCPGVRIQPARDLGPQLEGVHRLLELPVLVRHRLLLVLRQLPLLQQFLLARQHPVAFVDGLLALLDQAVLQFFGVFKSFIHQQSSLQNTWEYKRYSSIS